MTVTVFTDGGARPNPGPIGAGYYGEDTDGNSHVWWKSVPGSNSNNDAEVLAAIHAFKHAIEKNWPRVILRPDSEYVIGLIERRSTYLNNGFKNSKGLPLPNAEQAKELIELVEQYLKSGGGYVTQWVKGHSGVKGNELADQMATRGVIAAQKGVEVEESFTKPTKKIGKFAAADYNRLFANSHLYFISKTLKTSNGLYVYHSGHHGKDDQDAEKKGKVNTSFGKLLPEALSCLVLLKEPDKVIDSLINEQYRLMPGYEGTPFIVNLGNLFKPAVWDETKRYNGLYLHMTKRGKCLADSSLTPVARVHVPPKLGIVAMEKRLNRVDEVVEFLEGKSTKFKAFDVTDKVFETVTKTKGKKTVEELVLNLKLQTAGVLVAPVEVDINGTKCEAKFRLNIGHELYSVNALLGLRKENPKVEILTWQDGLGIRYAVLFSTDTGYALREPVASNLVMFKKAK